MSHLPVEIIQSIFSYLSPAKWCTECDVDGERETAARANLINAALVCKSWSTPLGDFVGPLDGVSINSVERFAKFLTKDRSSKQRSLSMVVGAEEQLEPVGIDDVVTVLRAAPHLDCLHITVQAPQPPRENVESVRHSLTRLALRFEGPDHGSAEAKNILLHFPRLSSLSLHSDDDILCEQHHRAAPFEGVRAHLPHLTKLELGMTGDCSQRSPLGHLLSSDTWAAVQDLTSSRYMLHMYDLSASSVLQRNLTTLKIVHAPGDEMNWIDLAFLRRFRRLTKLDLAEAWEEFELQEILPLIDPTVQELSMVWALEVSEPLPLPHTSQLRRLVLRYDGELAPDQAAKWSRLSDLLAERGVSLERWEE